jgi:predicted pyridoxine 5'-phosphate oxidase superfamily flavin-nucleotide-binding protein
MLLLGLAAAQAGAGSASLALGRCHMSRLYGPTHRSLQDRFDTRRLADNVETRVVLTEIPPEHKAFIESRDMFFLSTIDHQGRPTVSYKGGDPGFVRVLDNKTVAFPCYDGNGMFYSMGNLLGNQHVGMLFINFEKPHRLRLQGIASVSDDDSLLSEYAEAQLIVRVTVTEIFRNCPRYVHHYKKIEPSKFVPRTTGETPIAPWKRVDDIQAVLPARDRARADREGGLISRAEYEKYVTEVIKRES